MLAFDFINNYNTETYIGYKLIVYADCPVYAQQLHRDLPFLPEKKAINGATKLFQTFYDTKIWM